MIWIAGMIVLLAALFLVGLGLTGLIHPPITASFYQGFAQSARAHYTEQTLRILVGLGSLGVAAATAAERVFQAFGLVLVITGAGLMLVPWRWHQRFADMVIPMVIRYQTVYAVSALCLGIALIGGLMSVVLS